MISESPLICWLTNLKTYYTLKEVKMVGISLLPGSSCQDTFVRGCFPSTLGVWDRWFLMTPASLRKHFRGYVCSPHPSKSFIILPVFTFSYSATQYLTNGTQWGSFILPQGLRVQPTMAGKPQQQGLWSSWSHCAHSQDAERGESWDEFDFFFCPFQEGSP